MPHDDKGFSEEKCLRCGWVMGRQPLNCNNDNTPHIFPSQLRARSEWPWFPDPRVTALHGEFDAVVWAREFQRIVVEPKIEIDEGLMIGWFANAIMAGYDYARNHPEGPGSSVIISPGAAEDILGSVVQDPS